MNQSQAPGPLPPPAFLGLLRVGRARALLGWSRHDEAAAELGVRADGGAALAAEALSWRGAAWYFKTPRRAGLMQAWGRLRREHPTSLWAARVPPGQEASPGLVEKR